jgi:hypothetical protein
VDTPRLECCLVGELSQDHECACARQWASACVQQELGPVPSIEVRAAEREVPPHRLSRRATERYQALLVPLAEHTDDPLLESDATLLESDRLGHAQAGAVQELDECPVAQRSWARAGSRIDEALGLGRRQRAGKRARPPWQLKRGSRVLGPGAEKDEVTEIRTNGGNTASQGGGCEPVGSHRGEPALEVPDACVPDVAFAECRERGQIAPVGVDGPWRTTGCKEQQVALDVGIRGSHGAEPDSAARRLLLCATLSSFAAIFVVAALPDVAHASQLIARNTSTERLAVSDEGKALLTFHSRGRVRRILAWGALNAWMPTAAQVQAQFRIDNSGGWGTRHRPVWKTLRNACGPYKGLRTPWLVTACTAPDGSHWALQRWQRHQANFGLPPWKPGHGAWELRLSHWRGPLAQLEVWLDWSYSGRWHHLFGRLTYRGQPVHGFSTTPTGDPLDRYGRVLYLDTLDSAYGPGWRRENGFVSRNPDGTFCYGFVPHTSYTGELRPPGHGRRYRLAVSGPGVTPDVVWEGPGLHDFDPASEADRAHEAQMNELQRTLATGSKACHV